MFEPIETERLVIRKLVLDDLRNIHELTTEIGWADSQLSDDENLEKRREWLEWTRMSYQQLAALYQPPYSERGIVERASGQLVGLVGLVPLLAPFGRLASFGGQAGARFSTEMGLFWSMRPRFQRCGYASEAARALVAFAFDALNVERICACTEYDNAASIGVMRRLGMSIERNPEAEPAWFQITASLRAPGRPGER